MMSEKEFIELKDNWFHIALGLTAFIWAAWFFGRLAIGMIQVK